MNFGKIKSLLFSNKTTKQTVAKNTFWLFFGNTFSRLIRAALIIYAARILKTEDWGAFNYAMSLVAFFIIFADFGVNAVMTRESAQDPNQQERYFSTALFIKLVASVFIVIFLILIYPLILPHITSSESDNVLVGMLVPIVAFIVIFDSLRDFGAALSRAWERMEIEAAVQIFTNVAIVVAGIMAIYYIPTAKSLALGYTVGTAIGMVVAFIPFRHYFKSLFSKFSWKLIRGILMSSWPFGMMAVMGSIMLNTDSIMIGWLRSVEDVAYYSAGQRIVALVYTISGLIGSAFFPTMAKIVEQKERFKSILEKAIGFLGIIALPMTVGGFILSKQIILLIYGERFLPGTSTLMLLNFTYLPTFAVAILANALFALRKEMHLFRYVALAMFGNLILDIAFIPIWGIAGSALSTVINQVLSGWFLIHLIRKDVPFSFFSMMKKSAIASVGMGAVVYVCAMAEMPVIATIIIGFIAYSILILVLKEKVMLDIIHSGKRALIDS